MLFGSKEMGECVSDFCGWMIEQYDADRITVHGRNDLNNVNPIQYVT